MDKHAIIKLKEEGHSNREVARLTGIDRKTVARYWNERLRLSEELKDAVSQGADEDLRELQEQIVSEPEYDSSGRRPRKYTSAINALLDTILAGEAAKDAMLGAGHKQRLTRVQIHRMVKDAGHDIGITVLSQHIKEKEDRIKEAFIKQEYDLGSRLEYDFGEVRLVIGGIVRKLQMAVLSSPAGRFRWAYLYTNAKKEAFMDSHVRFFEMAGGVYDELVYDNMRNVVARFIGKSEKQLNAELIRMSLYYGFRINVTNCFSGNEKGHVEGSVKIIRKEAFAVRYRFDTIADAEAYLEKELVRMNADSAFEEERGHLQPYRPPLELADLSSQKVDKYSFVRVDNNFYSVPDYLVGRTVSIKSYPTEIVVYSAGNKVCRHPRRDGFLEASVDIMHYLGTFNKKPGALKNSVALRSQTSLKDVFDKYFVGREREFIAVLHENSDRELADIIPLLLSSKDPRRPEADTAIEGNILEKTASQLSALSTLFNVKGGNQYVN
jgi:transposase